MLYLRSIFIDFFACDVSSSANKLKSTIADVAPMFLNFKIDFNIS